MLNQPRLFNLRLTVMYLNSTTECNYLLQPHQPLKLDLFSSLGIKTQSRVVDVTSSGQMIVKAGHLQSIGSQRNINTLPLSNHCRRSGRQTGDCRASTTEAVMTPSASCKFHLHVLRLTADSMYIQPCMDMDQAGMSHFIELVMHVVQLNENGM
jgi:hypothetical protein